MLACECCRDGIATPYSALLSEFGPGHGVYIDGSHWLDTGLTRDLVMSASVHSTSRISYSGVAAVLGVIGGGTTSCGSSSDCDSSEKCVSREWPYPARCEASVDRVEFGVLFVVCLCGVLFSFVALFY